jgi:hypothetical protein
LKEELKVSPCESAKTAATKRYVDIFTNFDKKILNLNKFEKFELILKLIEEMLKVEMTKLTQFSTQ